MIKVWSDRRRAGSLERLGKYGSTFAYDPEISAQRAVSLTMPVRVQSYDFEFGMLPIFDMNLPEGALRERITRRFAKATGGFDEFDLLSVVGRTQIGRIRYSAVDQGLDEDVPFQSIDEILKARRQGELFDYLMEEFATYSGLSGVQPKVMIRARNAKLSEPKVRKSPTVASSTHIVKMWDEGEFPELAANEYFCLSAAKKLGLSVPDFVMSEDGGALVVERFDITEDGYLGFEDFCVLNALGSGDKYKGSYESRVFKRMKEFVTDSEANASLEILFKAFALNCAIRNGDAHLKNFGITYGSIDGPVAIAPIYDLVTTWAYIPNDPMALTIDGTTRWPNQATLLRLAQSRCALAPKAALQILEQIADALSAVAPDVERYFSDKEGEIGTRMLAAWRTGIASSLGMAMRVHKSAALPVAKRPRKPPKSDRLVLELLRQNNGSFTGTLTSVAQRLSMPLSTLSATIKRLETKGLLKKSRRSLSLTPTEV